MSKKKRKSIVEDKTILIKKEEKSSNPIYNQNLTKLGIILGIFTNIVGLIVGLCLYPANTTARNTLTKAWGITFTITIASLLIIYAIVCACITAVNPNYFV